MRISEVYISKKERKTNIFLPAGTQFLPIALIEENYFKVSYIEGTGAKVNHTLVTADSADDTYIFAATAVGVDISGNLSNPGLGGYKGIAINSSPKSEHIFVKC